LVETVQDPDPAAEAEMQLASQWLTVDARGMGGGWVLNVRATDLTDGSGNLIPAALLAIELANENIQRVDGNQKPLSLLTSPTPLSTHYQQLAYAAPGTGMGSYWLWPSFTLTIPKGTPSGTYASTITLNIMAGP
jgi:hypothetical protein